MNSSPTRQQDLQTWAIRHQKLIWGIIIAIAVLGGLFLLANTGSDEWESDSQRNQAFQEFYCKKLEEDPNEVGDSLISASNDLYSDPGDRAVLVRNARMIIDGAFTPTCDTDSPTYNQMIVESWAKVAEQQYGDNFTPSKAREAGVSVENN
ncbi:hypothetical protein I6J22_00390 [Corynebacterium kroppenstedtii]|uniref:Uncharacterized protein n=1 Tax=Corynebacterium kroppenstedtii (strain DSM 44385 / JCM 11950 / CIP 105744 / CCUG 35717) TaxID=645127 RepID=C4LJG3_CORK4|nr:hypothetical protein [Corynebacterium kroppenstedtii]ACR17968.1 hypothetical protein ckrop_1224 [Corynebacterium kroppenstedtii DSM 44385]QRP10637.1 hypothetical protein I6J22_00390 [Corynebacterium kroppenstedtii]